jgi:hypothetical protein
MCAQALPLRVTTCTSTICPHAILHGYFTTLYENTLYELFVLTITMAITTTTTTGVQLVRR